MVITEQRVARVLVELADTLVDEFDVLDFLATLADRAVELLHADAAVVLLGDLLGGLDVVAATNEQARVLQLVEVQHNGGPALECIRQARPLVNVEPSWATERWPQFGEALVASRYLITHVVPLRLRGVVVGAMSLFCLTDVRLGEDDLALGQALADVATIGLLQERAVRESGLLAEQLRTALESRVRIEQAKGVLVAAAGLDVDQAFQLMRGYSRRNNQPLRDVAHAIVERALTVDHLHTS